MRKLYWIVGGTLILLGVIGPSSTLPPERTQRYG
jgi:hypothetical protein